MYASPTFFYADPEIITTPPTKPFDLPEVFCQFDLSSDNLQTIERAAKLYMVPDLCLYTKNGDMILSVTDKKNDTSNTYEVPVGECSLDEDLCVCFKVENLRLQPERYCVSIYGSRVAEFVQVDEDNIRQKLNYFIALEPDSQWLRTTTVPSMLPGGK